MLRVFVYPPLDSRIPCTNVRQDKDLFETRLRDFFNHEQHPLRLRTLNPSNATIFYVPACLTDFFFRVRNLRNGSALLRMAEEEVLSQIAAFGYGHKPHIINALRCWSRVPRANKMNHISLAYPRLWANKRFHHFCTEAPREPDPARSVHMPYCPASTAPAATPPLRRRSTKVLFIGSHLMSRKHVLRALHRQNFTRKLVIINPFRRTAPGVLWCDYQHPLNTDCPTSTSPRQRAGIAVNSSDALAMMLDATYTLCPAGDAPDSPRVYSALAHGAVMPSTLVPTFIVP